MPAQRLVAGRTRRTSVNVAATAYHIVGRTPSDFMKGPERGESEGSPVTDSTRPVHDNRHRQGGGLPGRADGLPLTLTVG